MRGKVFIILSMCVFIWVTSSGAAETANIERPDKIVISGTIGKDTFQRTFEITSKAEITNLSFSATDLQEQGGDAWVGSRSVEIQPVSVASLKKDASASFTITIKNPTRPGGYSGHIRIRYDQLPREERVPIAVNVRTKPRLTLKDPSKIVIKTIRTSTKIPRDFTLYESERLDSVEGVTVIRPNLTTEDQARAISQVLLKTTLSATQIPKGEYVTGTLTLQDLSNVESGKYSGKLTIHSSNADDVEIPAEVSVKDDWLLPGLVLIIGIGMGLLLNWWDTKGRKRTELVDRIQQIQQALADDNMLNQVFGGRIEGLLSSATKKLERDDRNGAEEEVKKAEQKVDEWLYNGAEYLKRIERIQTTISTNIDQTEFKTHPYVVSIRKELETILKDIGSYSTLAALDDAIKIWRERIDTFDDLFKDLKTLREDFDKFESQIRPEQAANIKNRIDAASRKLRDAKLEKEVPEVRREVDAAKEALDNALQQPLPKGMLSRTPRAAIILPERPRFEVPAVDVKRKAYWVMKGAIPWVLLFLAAAFGLVTIYGGNDTFGATKWYSDYLGLFGWGLGVELTRSKLTEIIKSTRK
jgi:biopolymer transport protein ExbB/TolQ